MTLVKLKTNASHLTAHFNSSFNPCVTCPRGKAGMNGTCAQCEAVSVMRTVVLSLDTFDSLPIRLSLNPCSTMPWHCVHGTPCAAHLSCAGQGTHR